MVQVVELKGGGYMKQYVDVVCLYKRSGNIKPLYILWDNGAKYNIDKVTQIIPATSSRSGAIGMRYTCKIGQQIRYLFLEEGKWFIERVDYC